MAVNKCFYLRETADGIRCVFISPESFIFTPDCYKQGGQCPILARYRTLTAAGRWAVPAGRDERGPAQGPKGPNTIDLFFE